MGKDVCYTDYVNDETHMSHYSEYQKKYINTLRENDKLFIQEIRTFLAEKLQKNADINLIDIGCSTGNLLMHIKNTISGVNLYGADMVAKIIEDDSKNLELNGISFKTIDIVQEIDNKQQYDMVVMNAVSQFFDDVQYDKALANIYQMLKPGGRYLAFEYMHPFDQEVTVIQKTVNHPNGLKQRYRGYNSVQTSLANVGFKNLVFKPFEIKIDLKKPDDTRGTQSYTIKNENGKNMIFRGVLYQPWCFLLADKET